MPKIKTFNIDSEFLITHWSKLARWDLDDLLYSLNYVAFSLGAGCFYQCKEELLYRGFIEYSPHLISTGKGALNFLKRFYSYELIINSYLDSMQHRTGRLASKERDVYFS